MSASLLLVFQPVRIGQWQRCVFASPGVEANIMVVTASGSLLLLLLDELALDHDLDLFADDHLAIEYHINRQAKVIAVYLALSAVADPVAHIGIIEFPIIQHRKCHRVGVAFDGQVAGHAVVILPCRFDLSTFEGDRRILVDFKKIRCPQVVVPLFVVGFDTCRLHGDVH